jgi:4a-hydroxytetrahydrobiopterin dehydratase|tara:strand:+ start:105 stop:449 length:345 start_codon:yes stop_codon:yes gene_type:complete
MADRTLPADDESSGPASRLAGDRTLLTSGERAALAARLPAWGFDGDHLRRTFRFADFAEAWAFMGRVAAVAEALQHHPDWSNSWNQVEIAVTTHSAGGLTRLDVAFVEAVDALG